MCPKGSHSGGPGSTELLINDYIQRARWKVTQRETVALVMDRYAVGITNRGTYVPPGEEPPPGQRKLHLLIEGASSIDVENAKNELIRLAEEATANARPDEMRPSNYGRYKV